MRLEPVKQLGEYEVKVHLSPDTEPAIKVWVVSEADAGAQTPGTGPGRAEKAK